jgi:hypothetical protein
LIEKDNFEVFLVDGVLEGFTAGRGDLQNFVPRGFAREA